MGNVKGMLRQPQSPQPTPMEINQPNEAMEIPNITAQRDLSAELSILPEVSLSAGLSVSDISSIVPSGEQSEIVSPSKTPLLGLEMSQIVSTEVNTHEEPQMPSTSMQDDAATTFAPASTDAFTLKGFTKDTSDIIRKLDLAPPTKKMMLWKELGSKEIPFALPKGPIPACVHLKNYNQALTCKSYDHEDFGRLGTEEDL